MARLLLALSFEELGGKARAGGSNAAHRRRPRTAPAWRKTKQDLSQKPLELIKQLQTSPSVLKTEKKTLFKGSFCD